jgi:hypothetical protein
LIPRQAFAVMFGAILIGIALYTMWSAGRTAVIRPPLYGRFVVRRVMPGAEEGATFQYSYNLWYGVLSSAAIGLLSSLLGIGGGVFQVPVVINLLRFPVHIATATSQFVLLFMSGEGAVHLLHGHRGGEPGARCSLSAGVPGSAARRPAIEADARRGGSGCWRGADHRRRRLLLHGSGADYRCGRGAVDGASTPSASYFAKRWPHGDSCRHRS